MTGSICFVLEISTVLEIKLILLTNFVLLMIIQVHPFFVVFVSKMESDTKKNSQNFVLKFLYVSGNIYTKKSYLLTKQSNLHAEKVIFTQE